jgi:hypothetical protein
MHLIPLTRLHLAIALLAVCTATVQGAAIAVVLVALVLLRALARHHLEHPSTEARTAAATAAGAAPLVPDLGARQPVTG